MPRCTSWPDRRTGKPSIEQRAEGQVLGHRPVEARALFDHLAAGIEHALHGAVNLEGLGHLGELEADVLELLDRNAGLALARILVILGRLQAGPAAVEPVGLVGLVAFGHGEVVIQASCGNRPSSRRIRPP